jgi:hypothetical protein
MKSEIGIIYPAEDYIEIHPTGANASAKRDRNRGICKSPHTNYKNKKTTCLTTDGFQYNF